MIITTITVSLVLLWHVGKIGTSRDDLTGWLTTNGGVILRQEYWQFWDGCYWAVGNEVIPPRRTDVNETHQLTCVLIQKKGLILRDTLKDRK